MNQSETTTITFKFGHGHIFFPKVVYVDIHYRNQNQYFVRYSDFVSLVLTFFLESHDYILFSMVDYTS